MTAEQLIEMKNAWMASHIRNAEFPTPLSQQGLAHYLDDQASRSLSASLSSSDTNQLSLYPVDCHPLTVRFAVVLASRWEDESKKEAVLEFLTQIMFEENAPAQLFVGFFKGKPVACGMLYSSDGNTLISDVHAMALPNQDALISEMTQALHHHAVEQNSQPISVQA